MSKFKLFSFLSKAVSRAVSYLFLCLSLLSGSLFAASNPITVESIVTEPRQDEYRVGAELPFQAPLDSEPKTQSNAGSSNLGDMHYQMQILQQEVEQLRGLVESLSHSLKQLKATQDGRYLELDSRFQNLRLAEGKSEVSANTGDSNQGFAVAAQDEKTIYESAIQLIRGHQYDLAISQLQGLIDQYPNGSLTPNAYYWLGEVYAAKPEPDYENARKALSQVITFFPEHRKVPDAAFKLGKVYHLMGNCKRATELLRQVISEQQGRSVSKLAESYLRDKVGSCQ